MRNHLVVFARRPRLGAVKRRLAAGIGAVAALGFYRATLTRLLRRVGGDPRWRVWLAVTPDGPALRSGWALPRRAPHLIGQGGGDLGARMARPLHRLPSGPVVLVGSDIPDIGRGHVAAAFRALGRHEFVFGPAEDGGFWLVGARRRPRLAATRVGKGALYQGVRWSTADALADTLAGLPRSASVGFVARLEDVDGVDAWRRWRRRGAAGGMRLW